MSERRTDAMSNGVSAGTDSRWPAIRSTVSASSRVGTWNTHSAITAPSTLRVDATRTLVSSGSAKNLARRKRRSPRRSIRVVWNLTPRRLRSTIVPSTTSPSTTSEQ